MVVVLKTGRHVIIVIICLGHNGLLVIEFKEKNQTHVYIRMWCWWCCHPFEGTPLSMPYKHDERRNKFYTSGNFCSWSCMKTYVVDKYGCNRGGLICGNMVMMRRKQFNKIGTIKRAPHRQRLDVFGGDLTIDQFRENNVVDEEQPNEIEIIPIISSTKKLSDITSSTGKNETLRLKREKPLKRNENNLESVLGLVIKTKA